MKEGDHLEYSALVSKNASVYSHLYIYNNLVILGSLI